MKPPITSSILIAASLGLALAAPASAQTGAVSAVSPKVLPSVAQVKVQRGGGVTGIGTGFVAVKDGLMVTALHVLRDAAKVTVTFASGEEFEAVGLVDKDERRNLALVRIRAFGRPVLASAQGELAVGARVFAAVVKDGAFGVVEASVAGVTVQGPMKYYRLAGDIPGGNSGAPVVNAIGEVVGLHMTLSQEGRDIEIAVPATYALGLEPSLPVQPWSPSAQAAGAPPGGGAQPQTPGVAAGASPATDGVDAELAAAIINVHDWAAFFQPLSERLYAMTRYTNTNRLDLYQYQSQMDTAISKIGWVKPADPLREKLVQAVGQVLARERQGLELDINCWLLNKDAGPGKHIPEAEDAARRATAIFEAIPSQVSALQPDFRALAQQSPKFLAPLSPEMRYFLGIEPRKSTLVLGVYLHSTVTMQVLSFARAKPLAGQLGLQPADLIVSAGGRTFKPEDDMEDFKLLIESNAGRTLEVVVKRGGKLKTLQAKIPADVMQRYAR